MDFSNPHFAEPGWLWLAVLGPPALFAMQRLAARSRVQQLSRFAAADLLPELLKSHSPGRRILKDIFLLIAVAAVGIALARPQWGETTEVYTALGEDILFTLDCSRSMFASDVLPSRLERAKYAILDFVQKHGRGRVGLVAFSGQAFLQCPLTFDYDAFREALLSVDDTTIPVRGTDIGRALDESFRAMGSDESRKTVILVTDGEDLEKSGITTAQALAKKGIVVYAVGVGTAAGSPIKVMNPMGISDFLKDRSGNVVQSHLDENTLKAIAEATHGSYHILGPLGEGLASIRQEVEGSPHASDFARKRKLGVDRYYFPVALLTFLILWESLLGTRRKVRENAG